MLADVIREKELKRQRDLLEENEKYNQPYKRDTIIYIQYIHIIGGIETWIKNLSKYEFSLVYDTGKKERLDYLESLGIELIKYVGQPIECNKLIRTLYGNADIKAKETDLYIHGDYKYLNKNDLIDTPHYDNIYAVSKVAADSFKEVTGIDVEVRYNPVEITDCIKPLIIGVFSRLSSEKGRERIKILIDRLQAYNKPFLMLIFTDLEFSVDDERVIFIKPVMNPIGWMYKCDYICQLSDTEAGCFTIQEALKIGKPIIVTKLPILEEFNITDKVAKILEFDMSNLDVEDLWNIPKVNWKEPVSKEWEKMKKRVFRKMQEKPKVEEVKEVKEEKEEKPKKKTTKKKES